MAEPAASPSSRAFPAALALAALAAVLAASAFAAGRCSSVSPPALPPLSSSISVVQPTPNVLVAVRDLARLESTTFHMERVIDLTDKQSHLFGLVQAEDAILLVAVADISAGVDLGKLQAGDIVADPSARKVRIHLPAPEVLRATLDPQRTYVHTRRTSTLAQRKESLETRARQEAERTLVDAAQEAGLLDRAGENARRIVEGLVRSLGYEDVDVSVREAPKK